MADDGEPVDGSHPAPRAQRLRVAGADGQRIDNYLLRELKGLPRSRVYRMLRSGEVRVNGGRVKPGHRLADGDEVRVPPLHGLSGTERSSEAFIGQAVLADLSRAIVYEDDGLLVLDKPAGMPVHGGSGLSFGAIEGLRRLRPEADLALAHRLDRDTSGCLLVAKSRAVLLELHRALRDREVKKRYRVIVHGAWPRRTATVQVPLERYVTGSGERRVRVAAAGKASRTDFAVIDRRDRASLLEARLHTGRTHQIRVHALAAGHAVVGDQKYASDAQLALARELGVHRLCLHAEALVFEYGGRRRRFEVPVPADFEAAWAALADGH
ncbi:MAG: RluA family pseudouridine synthase [Pseudomonadales bacterium]